VVRRTNRDERAVTMSSFRVDFKPSKANNENKNELKNRFPNPPGFSSTTSNKGTDSTTKESNNNKEKKGTTPTTTTTTQQTIKRDELKMQQFRIKNAYKFAQASLSTVMMTSVMMWFTGNGIQIFSIMVTFNGLFQPIKAILSSGKTFERFAEKNTDVTTPRLMYCIIQLMGLAMALRKLNAMGLLPTHASDWLSGLKPPVFYERAYGGTEM